RVRQGARRRPVWVAGAACGLVATLGLGLWIFVQDGEQPNGPGPSPRSLPFWEKLEVRAGGGKREDEVFDRVAFPTRDVGYLASRRAVYRTEDGGRTWNRLPETGFGRVHLLHFEDTRAGWLGADTLHRTSDGGKTWSKVPLPEPTNVVKDLA